MTKIKIDVVDGPALDAVDVSGYFRALRGGIAAALRDARTVVSDVPPKQIKRVSQYWTPKQRAWFWAALRDGKIDVPYKRGISPGSKDAAKQWRDSIEGAGLIGVLSNSVPYAKYLYDPVAQSKYHKGNWKTTDEMARLIKPRAVDIVSRALTRL